MPFYEHGDVRIHYEEIGSGFPLLLIPGGGLNSTISFWTRAAFNPMEELEADFRSITADLRNTIDGQSTGPLHIERPSFPYTSDQLGLIDHISSVDITNLITYLVAPFL